MDIDNRKSRPFTVKEVAWWLRVSEITVIRMLKDGRLKGAKIGAHWRIPQENLQAYLKIGEDNE